MGSFSVSCGLSSLPIYPGDKVGFMLLTEPKHKDWPMASYTRSHALYLPLFAPVYGEYNDYGGIENIVRTKSVTMLEEMFGTDIETIIGHATDGGSIYGSNGYIKNHGINPDLEWGKFGVPIKDDLLAFGFRQVGEQVYFFEEFFVSINKRLTNEALPGFYSYDFTIDKVDGEGTKPVGTIPNVTDIDQFLGRFAELTGVYPGAKPEMYESLALLRKLSGMFFLKKVFKKVSEHVVAVEKKENEDYPGLSTLDDDWTEMMEYGPKNVRDLKELAKKMKEDGCLDDKVKEALVWKLQAFDRSTQRAYQSIARTTSFPLGKLGIILKDEENTFLEVFAMGSVMAGINRMFMPSYCGAQEGNLRASEVLLKVSTEILQKKKKRYHYED